MLFVHTKLSMELPNHPFSPANFRCRWLCAATSPHSRLAGVVHLRLAPDGLSQRASRVNQRIWGVHGPFEIACSDSGEPV